MGYELHQTAYEYPPFLEFMGESVEERKVVKGRTVKLQMKSICGLFW